MKDGIKELKMKDTYINLNVKEVLGLDVEREDREVGAFGNEFILVVKDEKGNQEQLSFNDEKFIDLLDILKPFFREREKFIGGGY